MNLVVDENIALADEAFGSFGKLLLLNGRSITNETLRDTDILIVRSVTNVTKELLNNTAVRFVGTATIGTDHIDTEYLLREGIEFTNANGCNSTSVAEYVIAALMRIAVENNLSLKNKSIGVIGVGNVGGRVVEFGAAMGMEILKNDPPKERANIVSGYSNLDDVFQADIVTLHVPLSLAGTDKTFHLLNKDNLKRLKHGAIVINTSRGPVIDNDALLNIIDDKQLKVVLDVWEGEPLINTDLLDKVKIGTVHIAGYSLEGKVNGTKLIYDSLKKFTNSNTNWVPILPSVKENEIELPSSKNYEKKLRFIFNQTFNIGTDDSLTRKLLTMKEDNRGMYFDKLRKEYQTRREFSNYSIIIKDDESVFNELLKKLGFNLIVSK